MIRIRRVRYGEFYAPTLEKRRLYSWMWGAYASPTASRPFALSRDFDMVCQAAKRRFNQRG